MPSIDNFKLAKLASKLNINLKFNNIISKNELNSIPCKSKMNMIINLDDNTGSHWCCFIVRSNCCFWCDTFGVICPNEIVEYCMRNGLHLGYNRYIIQSLNSKNCGYFALCCVKWLEKANKNNLYNRANEFVNCFVDYTKFNDGIMRKLLNIGWFVLFFCCFNNPFYRSKK